MCHRSCGSACKYVRKSDRLHRAKRLREVVQRSQSKLSDARKVMNAAQSRLRDVERVYDRRLRTDEQFEAHARQCVQPGLDYFRHKFVQDNAPLKHMLDVYLSSCDCL